LCDFDCVVNVVNNHAVVGDIADGAAATAALQVARESRRGAGPDLDARAIGSVGHGDVVDVDVFNQVDFAGILAERADADAVAAVAYEVLNDDVCAVGLERDAVIAVVDV
jgi:hypothetical protein